MTINTLAQHSRKITAALFVSQSLFAASSIMGFTVASIIILELTGQNSAWAGVPGTLNMAGAALMAYPVGWLMDRLGRRVGLSVGYVCGLVGASLVWWAVVQEYLWLFLFGILLIGFTKGANDQGRYAAAEANPPAQRGRALSLIVFGGTVGSVVGPTLIAYTSDLALRLELPPLSGPWLLMLVFFGTALLVLNIFLRPDPQQIAQALAVDVAVADPLAFSEQPVGRSVSHLFRVPAVQVAIGALVIGQLVMVLIMAITPVHMHLHNHDLGAISGVIMAHTLGMFGLSFFSGWLVDRLGPTRMIMAGCLVLVSACLIAPLSLLPVWLGLGLFLLGLGWNFCYVAGSTLLDKQLQPGEKGKIQGSVDTLVSLSSATGSLSSGLVFAVVGFAPMNWLGMGVALLPALLVLILLPKAAPQPQVVD